MRVFTVCRCCEKTADPSMFLGLYPPKTSIALSHPTSHLHPGSEQSREFLAFNNTTKLAAPLQGRSTNESSRSPTMAVSMVRQPVPLVFRDNPLNQNQSAESQRNVSPTGLLFQSELPEDSLGRRPRSPPSDLSSSCQRTRVTVACGPAP